MRDRKASWRDGFKNLARFKLTDRVKDWIFFDTSDFKTFQLVYIYRAYIIISYKVQLVELHCSKELQCGTTVINVISQSAARAGQTT